MHQVCRRCHHPFETIRRRLRPVCTACLVLPDPIPSWPWRWLYSANEEPEWLRQFLKPRLFGEQSPAPATLRPEPAVKSELRCRDCGALIPRRSGSGAQK
jgi:hypothetical protein